MCHSDRTCVSFRLYIGGIIYIHIVCYMRVKHEGKLRNLSRGQWAPPTVFASILRVGPATLPVGDIQSDRRPNPRVHRMLRPANHPWTSCGAQVGSGRLPRQRLQLAPSSSRKKFQSCPPASHSRLGGRPTWGRYAASGPPNHRTPCRWMGRVRWSATLAWHTPGA
jgi:hypothetical protein